jgi:hypothetical protein
MQIYTLSKNQHEKPVTIVATISQTRNKKAKIGQRESKGGNKHIERKTPIYA